MESSSGRKSIKTDVLIVGSGPIGCAFARVLIESNTSHTLKKILMIDAGQQFSIRPGENIRNSYYFSKNIKQFTPIVEGTSQLISVAPDSGSLPYPLVPSAELPKHGNYELNHINPKQEPGVNLPAAVTTYAIGGMAIHWTCCTPRTEPGLERPEGYGIGDQEWDGLYEQAEGFFKTNTKIFQSSIRQQVLQSYLKEKESYRNRVVPMPMAGVFNPKTRLVTWSGADTVLGASIVDPLGPKGINKQLFPDTFDILQQTRCTKLIYKEIDVNGSKINIIQEALVRDLQSSEDYSIEAKVYIVACNPVSTPQLLWNSDIRPDALGKYLCDQPMTFCQIVLSKDVLHKIEQIKSPSTSKVNESTGNGVIENIDPVSVPIYDPPPALLLKVTKEKPWQVQIHKDTHSYGELPVNMDPRVILDIRYFGRVAPRETNFVKFEDKLFDLMGLPQPTFHFNLNEKENNEIHLMMKEMTELALYLGAFLPGMEPKMMPLGTSLHFQGTHRLGVDPNISVTDNNSLVWNFNNLYLGGNGSIPTSISCNPTLTSVAIAIRAAKHIVSTHQVAQAA